MTSHETCGAAHEDGRDLEEAAEACERDAEVLLDGLVLVLCHGHCTREGGGGGGERRVPSSAMGSMRKRMAMAATHARKMGRASTFVLLK